MQNNFYKDIAVFNLDDEKTLEILDSDIPKFVFFVESPEHLSRFFKTISRTTQKITTGYFKCKVKPENIYIFLGTRTEFEYILMDEVSELPIGFFAPDADNYHLITF